MRSTGAPPSTDVPRRGGLLGFLGTVPGILTASAGVVAVVALLCAVLVTTNPPTLTEPAQPAPESSTGLDPGNVVAEVVSASLTDATLDDETAALVTNCAGGLVAACTTLLDLLAEGCSDGDPYACDVLYRVGPLGSEYEVYGATCGGRFGSAYVGRCTER